VFFILCFYNSHSSHDAKCGREGKWIRTRVKLLQFVRWYTLSIREYLFDGERPQLCCIYFDLGTVRALTYWLLYVLKTFNNLPV
jgi:hypothetical protein